MSVTVTLEDEIEFCVATCSSMPSPKRAGPIRHVAADIDAMVVWMNEVPFVPGKSYWFKQTTRTSPARWPSCPCRRRQHARPETGQQTEPQRSRPRLAGSGNAAGL